MVTALFFIIGPLSVCVMLLVLGELSHRLGRVTRVPRYYRGFYIAALLIALNALFYMLLWAELPLSPILMDTRVQSFVLLGFPAVGLTIALAVAWRYWSWLLAERA
jgi:hypothetical protein